MNAWWLLAPLGIALIGYGVGGLVDRWAARPSVERLADPEPLPGELARVIRFPTVREDNSSFRLYDDEMQRFYGAADRSFELAPFPPEPALLTSEAWARLAALDREVRDMLATAELLFGRLP